LGPQSGARRRDRGGSYHNNASRCRAGNRDTIEPSETWNDTGLRLARSAR
jgi:formylglycine-generating enzyme required for sulfatase activity